MKSNGKVCIKCNEWKEFGEYRQSRTTKDGYKSYCKDCREEHMKQVGNAKKKWYLYVLQLESKNGM